MRIRFRNNRNGNALIMFTLATPFFILPLVGLAIDGALVYCVKAKLSSAVDGGAIAAARSLSVGLNLAVQTAAAKKTAQQYLVANYPAGYLGVHDIRLDPPVEVKEENMRRTVAITAKATVPLLFMRMLGKTEAYVNAYGKAARRDVRLMVVLDKSASMSGQVNDLRNAPKSLVDFFAEGRDQLGLVVYGTSAMVAFPPLDPDNGTGPTTNFKSANPNMYSLIGSIGAGSSNTGMAEALYLAYQELLKKPLPGALNVIVLFTDGLPNGVTANFNAAPTLLKKCTNANTPTTPIVGVVTQGNYFKPQAGIRGIYQIANDLTKPTSSVPGWVSSSAQQLVLPAPASDGCSFHTDDNKPTKDSYFSSDIKKLPAVDIYGNKTFGVNGYLDSDLYKTYGILQTLDTPDNAYQIGLISWNATDEMAKKIRNDQNLNPVIMAIGFEHGSEKPDKTLMERIANVNSDRNHIYDATRPTGRYENVTDSDALASAFAQIASEILRLAN